MSHMNKSDLWLFCKRDMTFKLSRVLPNPNSKLENSVLELNYVTA